VKIGRWILLALVLAGAGYFAWTRWSDSPAAFLGDTVAEVQESMVPAGVRIKVEVLNATDIPGLARKATMFLRDRGFDVVEIGNSSEKRPTTLVLDRSGNPAWAGLVGEALSAKVEAKPDTSRYLDVTVMLGEDWHPPALPFYP
jgi:hypothetical protein